MPFLHWRALSGFGRSLIVSGVYNVRRLRYRVTDIFNFTISRTRKYWVRATGNRLRISIFNLEKAYKMKELEVALGFFVIVLLEIGMITKISSLQDTVSNLQEQVSMVQATVCTTPNDSLIETETEN